MGIKARVFFYALFLIPLVVLSGFVSAKAKLFVLEKKVYVGKKNWGEPLIYGERIYYASNGNKNDEIDEFDALYCFDKNLNLLWKFFSPEGKDTDMNGVVGCRDFVLVSADNGYVYAVSKNGKLLWKFKCGSHPKALALFDLNGDGVPDAIVGSESDYLYAISGKNGKLLWKFKTGSWVISSPAIGDINGDGKVEVVVGSDDGNLYAISGENGKLLWKFKTGSWVDSSPAIGDINGDGKVEVVVGSYDNYLYAVTGDNGKLVWKFQTQDDIISSPAIGDINGDGKVEVVVGSDDGNLYAISGKNGKLLWKFKTGEGVDDSPVLGDVNGDGKVEVIFGSVDGNLYAVSGKNGKLLWKFKTGEWIYSSPALGDVDGDGKVEMVVASFDGYLYYFKCPHKTGKITWARWHGDAYGTGSLWNAKTFGQAVTSKVLISSWQPNPVSLKTLFKIAKKYEDTSVLKMVKFRITESPLINKAVKHIALKKAIILAKKELKRKVALKVKKVVKTLAREAGITDKKVIFKIESKLTKELFKEIKNLKPFYEVYELNAVYVLFKYNPVPDIPTRAAKLFANLIENGSI